MKSAMKMLRACALLVMLGSAALLNASSKKVAAAPITEPAKYIIGADDVLAINVWHEPELSKTVPVRPDGKISLPLVGEFQASGKTPEVLQTALKQEFSKYIQAPDVTVIVEQIKSQKINVIGEVAKPGSFPYSSPMSVLDAISIAGGLKDFAKTKKIYILRRSEEGATSRVRFDYKRAIKGEGNRDIALMPRDTVVVP